MKIAAAAAAVAIAASVTVFAAYDSSKDPIVSLSYLTDIFKPEVKNELKTELKSSLKTELKNELKSELKTELKNEIKSEIKSELKSEIKSELESELKDTIKSELEAEMKDKIKTEIYNSISGDFNATVDALQKQIDVLSNEYEVVTLTKGKVLRASSACEIVVLSGSASVKCAATDKGLIDCTDGIILYDGQSIPLNHKILVPDNGDNRGLSAAGAVEVLVKGGYTLG